MELFYSFHRVDVAVQPPPFPDQEGAAGAVSCSKDMSASGCRTGKEYTWAWEKLMTEAWLYLEKDIQGPLEPEVEGAGYVRSSRIVVK